MWKRDIGVICDTGFNNQNAIQNPLCGSSRVGIRIVLNCICMDGVRLLFLKPEPFQRFADYSLKHALRLLGCRSLALTLVFAMLACVLCVSCLRFLRTAFLTSALFFIACSGVAVVGGGWCDNFFRFSGSLCGVLPVGVCAFRLPVSVALLCLFLSVSCDGISLAFSLFSLRLSCLSRLPCPLRFSFLS